MRIPKAAALAAALIVGAASSAAATAIQQPSGVVGTLVQYQAVPSAHVDSRNVTVWLPPDYDQNAGPYAVLYMHDGQNLFDPATSYAGEWGVDEVLSALMAEGKVRNTIVVGIWNTPKRYADYYPAEALRRTPPDIQEGFKAMTGTAPLSDGYLTFIVEELKPYIDRTYRTDPGRESTFVMGSSMGGLISCYAVARHPDVFGGAGCISTHWPMAGVGPDGAPDEVREVLFKGMLDTLADGLNPDAVRVYYDFGTIGLDAHYEPYQTRVDAMMAAKGFFQGRNWMTVKVEGGDHHESSWRRQLHVPLTFLLAPGK